MKLSIFFSGACFGAVVGLVAGYLVVADELRAQRQQPEPAPAAHQHQQQPTPRERVPDALPIEKPVLDAESIAPIEAALRSGGGMEAIQPLIGKLRERGAKDPKDYAAFVGLARIFIEVNMWSKAAAVMEKAAKARPDAPTRLALAQCYYRAGAFPASERRCRELIAANAADESAHELLIVSLARQKKFPDAREAIDAALESIADQALRTRLKALRASMPGGEGS